MQRVSTDLAYLCVDEDDRTEESVKQSLRVHTWKPDYKSEYLHVAYDERDEIKP